MSVIRPSFDAVGLPGLHAQRRARMYLHANAKLGLAGRLALVRAVEEGCSLKQAAATTTAESE